MKGLWVEIRTGRDHPPTTVTGKNRLSFGKLVSFISNQIGVG